MFFSEEGSVLNLLLCSICIASVACSAQRRNQLVYVYVPASYQYLSQPEINVPSCPTVRPTSRLGRL